MQGRSINPAEATALHGDALGEGLSPTGRSSGLGIKEIGDFPHAVQLHTVLGCEFDVEFLSDQFRERDEVRRGHARLDETDVQVLRDVYRFAIDLEVVSDELHKAVACGSHV